MIVVNGNYGQLCNRLFLYSHLLAYGFKEGRRVWYPGFFENTPFFPNLSKTDDSNCIFGKTLPSWIHKTAHVFFQRFFYSGSKPARWIRAITGKPLAFKMEALEDVCYPDLEPVKLPDGLCFFQGWAFRMHETWRRHNNRLRELFEFPRALREQAAAVVHKRAGGLTIGVHVRRGDYREMSPQWVYPKEFWLGLMGGLRADSGGKARFVVVSDDEELDFREDWIDRHRGDRFEDLAVLAACDLIAGPPSTFNRWAAFSGNKPHYCVWSEAERPQLGGFSKFKLCLDSKVELNHNDLNAIRWYGVA